MGEICATTMLRSVPMFTLLLVLAFTCSTSAHSSNVDQWSEAAASAASDDEPQGEDTPGPSPPTPSSSGSKDPTCKGEGWCQSPEATYSQQCTEDAGPAWSDDGQTYPNKHYWSAHPSKPQLPNSGSCPAPLAASCARKGIKAAHLDGPIDCGGKGFFCRIMPQTDWVNSDAKPMMGEKASFHLKVFKEANFYHCNTTSKTEAEKEQGHPHSQGHCHGGITDEIYGWWTRDHFFRGYAGTLHCCCDYKGGTVGVVDSCDVRRPVSRAEQKAKQCTDVNEDARAQHMYKGGCTAAHKASFNDPLTDATPGQETCWSVTSFGVGGPPGKQSTLIEDRWSE